MKRLQAELTKHRKRKKRVCKCARDGKRVRWTKRERARDRERERQERRKDKKSERNVKVR